MPNAQGYPHVVASTDGGENLGKPGRRWGEVHAMHIYSYASGSPVEINEAGPPGDTGASAYEAWLAAGNTGDEAAFLASLNGKSAYQLWLDAGNTGDEADFLASLKGADGADGSGSGDMLASTYDPIIMAITGEATVDATPDTTLAALWALPWTEGLLLSSPAAGFVSPYKPLSRNGRLTELLLQTGPGETPASATTVNLFVWANTMFTGSLTNSATTGTLIGDLTLSNACYMLIDKEVIQVTAIGGTTLAGSPITGTALTFTRGQGGTTAAAHDSMTPMLIFAAGGSLSSKSGMSITSFRDSGTINGTAGDYTAFHVASGGLSACSVTCQAKWGNR